MKTRGGEGSRRDGSKDEAREEESSEVSSTEHSSTEHSGTELSSTEAPRTASGDIDWSRPEKLQQASSLWVALWLAVPLVSCLIYGFLTR